MKRVLCLLLCLMLVVPFAAAETADTLPKRFARQLSGGNGVRGYASITASGLADWLSALLPFTATDIQIRAIGEKQGEMSEEILDDDDWQVKFYVENSAEEEVGTSWLYGDPKGVYFQSELLPDTVLTVPVEQTHLLYEFFRGEWVDLFFSFDPMDMNAPGANGNASAYEAVARVLGVPADEWASNWLPVLEKYFLQLDLWLASYGDPSFVTGEETGSLRMTATYNIPAEELKKEAKYIIGQMLYDNDLQSLLVPYVTMEQRVTYLNPTMVYFYEACIDALPLEGDIILSREMSGMGEVVNTTVSLPLPTLPETLTVPADEALAAVFGLEEVDWVADVDRVVMVQSGLDRNMTFSGEKRTITLSSTEIEAVEDANAWKGMIKIIPNASVDENALSAAFSIAVGQKIWQDEKYLDHDTSKFSIEIAPALENLDEDDPFRSSYIEFQPISLSVSVDFRNNPNQANSAVQINVDVDAQLPDAQVQAEIVLRITTQMEMKALPTTGAEDFTQMTDERKDELLQQLIANAVDTMANLNADALEAPAAEVEDAEAAEESEVTEDVEPTAEATVVPPAAPPVSE